MPTADPGRVYDAIVRTHYRDLYRYAYWLCRNSAQAEDLVQESLLRAWKSFDGLRDEKAVKAWLFTIVRRENARLYQRYRPPMDDIEDQSLTDARTDAEAVLKQEILQRAIASLELEYREPLLLQIIGGYSVNEIAEMLNLNLNTTLARLFRGRNKLKALYADGAPGEDSSAGQS